MSRLWRAERGAPLVHDADLDTLRTHVLGLAKQLLRKTGHFDPFAASLSQSGVPAAVVVASGSNQPDRQAWIDSLTSALVLETTRMQLRAVGVCCCDRVPARVRREGDPAVLVRLEHRNGSSSDVYVPHRTGWFGRVRYGAFIEMPGTLRVFGSRRAESDASLA